MTKKPAKRNMVAVDRRSVYFPTPEDPEGEKHVQQKFLEAEATVNLLLVGIARSGVPLDLLDLPGAAQSIKEHLEQHPSPINRTYPGPSIVHQVVLGIRQVRDILDAEHKKAVAAKAEGQDTAQSPQAGHQPAETQPEPSRLH